MAAKKGVKSNEKSKKKGKINIFNIMSVFFVIICSWYSYETYKFYTKHKRIASQREDLVFEPNPSLLLIMIPGTILIKIIKRYSTKHFRRLANWIVRSDKSNWSKADRESRVEKCATNIYKSINYILLTVVGYYLLKDECYFPKSLGGHGEIENMWTDLPYQSQNNKLIIYYLFAGSYHLNSLIDQFNYIGKPNFGDMMLHHIITICLILFSYFNNYVRIGALVLFIHDISDIFGSLVKIWVNSQKERLVVALYINMMAGWIYFRLYVYPFIVINSAIKQVPNPVHEKNKFLILLMSSLVVLHVYWFFTFIFMFLSYSKTDEFINLHDEGFDKIEEIKKQKEKNVNKSKMN